MDNLDLIYSLFNQYLFQDAKNNIENLEYYFNTNPATSGNTLVEGLLKAIKTYSYDTIDVPLFQSILQRDKKNATEQKKIMGKIMEWRGYNKEQMIPSKKYLRDICAGVMIQRANNRHQESAYDFYQYIKNSELKLDNSDILGSVGFGEIDMASVMSEGGSTFYPSSFEWIGNLFEPAHQYEGGQMVLVSCPPGTGKTLFMMTEALNMALTTKYKCHYLAMGDMKPRDFITRMGAIYTGKTFGEVSRNLPAVYNTLKQFIQDRLDISVIAAGQVTASEYVDYVRSKDYDVVFIDYDSNFKLNGSDSMYNDFGIVYNELTKLTQDGRLVFIAAQPNKNCWNNSVIEMGDVGESSRKVHTADIVFTAGRIVGCPNHVGMFKCCKNRRGEEGSTTGYIRLNNGRFKFVPVPIAEQLGSIREKRFYTDGEIDMQLEEFRRISSSVEGGIQGHQASVPRVSNPFQNRR